jgi:hypothetical protein
MKAFDEGKKNISMDSEGLQQSYKKLTSLVSFKD